MKSRRLDWGFSRENEAIGRGTGGAQVLEKQSQDSVLSQPSKLSFLRMTFLRSGFQVLDRDTLELWEIHLHFKGTEGRRHNP